MTQPQTTLPVRLWHWIRVHRNAVIAVGFWVGIILITRQVMQANNLTFNDLIEQLRGILTGSWYGPLLYITVYVLRPLILFPAWLLTILGGSVFGLAAGFVYVLIGGTASAGIPYVIGRFFSSGEKNDRAPDSRIGKFIDVLKRHPFQTILLMRLLYLPYDGVSLFAGSLRISVLAFFLATAVGNLGGTLSFVGIGSSIQGDLSTGDITVNPESLVLSVVIFVISMLISFVLNRVSRRQQNVNATTQKVTYE
jgi:uncharacterized membrane protein YdjX (TVP38/TMEM64 family)